MKGSEKQIEYATWCLASAKAWWTSTYTHDYGSGPVEVPRDRYGSQIAAIAAVEAIERGDYAAADQMIPTAAGWWERCLVRGSRASGAPVIDAGAVIDYTKDAAWQAKRAGMATDYKVAA